MVEKPGPQEFLTFQYTIWSSHWSGLPWLEEGFRYDRPPYEIMNIWTYMWTAEWRIIWRSSQLYTQLMNFFMNFFRLSFATAYCCVYNCDDRPSNKTTVSFLTSYRNMAYVRGLFSGFLAICKAISIPMAATERLYKTMILPILTTVMWPGKGVEKFTLMLSRQHRAAKLYFQILVSILKNWMIPWV